MKELPDLTQIPEQSVPITTISVRRPSWREPMNPELLGTIAESGCKLSVVLVRMGGELVLADGEKMLTIAKNRGCDCILAKIVDGDEWLRLALMGFTNLHGQALTIKEREALLTTLLSKEPDSSDPVIAQATGFSPGKVKMWRDTVPGAKTEFRVGADGRRQKVNSAARSAAAKAAAAKKAAQRTGRPCEEASTIAPTAEGVVDAQLSGRLAVAQLIETRKAELVAILDGWTQRLRTTELDASVLQAMKLASERLIAALSLGSAKTTGSAEVVPAELQQPTINPVYPVPVPRIERVEKMVPPPIATQQTPAAITSSDAKDNPTSDTRPGNSAECEQSPPPSIDAGGATRPVASGSTIANAKGRSTPRNSQHGPVLEKLRTRKIKYYIAATPKEATAIRVAALRSKMPLKQKTHDGKIMLTLR